MSDSKDSPLKTCRGRFVGPTDYTLFDVMSGMTDPIAPVATSRPA